MPKRSYRPKNRFEVLPTWARSLIEEMGQDINNLGYEIVKLKEKNITLESELEQLKLAL